MKAWRTIDILQQMLDEQVSFQARIPFWNETTPEVDRLEYNATQLMVEAAEVMQSLPWKKHKNNHHQPLTEEQREKVIEEMVDTLIFVLNGFLIAGCTRSKDIMNAFNRKYNVNVKRQESNY